MSLNEEERLLDARILLEKITNYPEEGWQQRCADTWPKLAKLYKVDKETLYQAWSKHNLPTIMRDAFIKGEL